MDLNRFEGVDLDSNTEIIVMELASFINSLSSNYPDIEYTCLVDNISKLLSRSVMLFDTNRDLVEKNDYLYSRNLELELYIENIKKEKRDDLNHSFQIQDSLVEKNEFLNCEIESLKAKVVELKSNLNKTSNLCSHFKEITNNTSNISNSDHSFFQQKISQQEKTIKIYQNKLKETAELNDILTVKLDNALQLNKSIECKNADKWFDDSILQAYLSSFNDHPIAVSSKALFIDPSVSEILKFGCTSTVNDQLQELKVMSYNYVFCTVSNSKGSMSSSTKVFDKHDEGSHWSLLFFDIANKVAFHLDSMEGLNENVASSIAIKFGCSFRSLPCYKQNNGFECGLNVLVNAKFILYFFCSISKNSSFLFLEWFQEYLGMSSDKLNNECNVGHARPKYLQSAKSHDSQCANKKLSLKLKRVECNNWIVVRSKRKSVNGASCGSSFSVDVSNRFSGLADLDIPSEITPSMYSSKTPDSSPKLPHKCDSINVKTTSQALFSSKIKQQRDKYKLVNPIKHNVGAHSNITSVGTKRKIFHKKNYSYKPLKNTFVVEESIGSQNVSLHTTYRESVHHNNNTPCNTSVIKDKQKTNLKLFSDSHGRFMSGMLGSKTNDDVSVFGLVKPNAMFQEILNSARKEVLNMTDKDYIILMGGTNNFVNGRCIDFTVALDGFLGGLSWQRVILVGIPFRYDIPSLNPEISRVNHSLKELSIKYINTSFVPLDGFPRQFFTRHGLHLNHKGKTHLSTLLSNTFCSSSVKSCPSIGISSENGVALDFSPHTLISSSKGLRSSNGRTFLNTNFLGPARKPSGVPWSRYLVGVLGAVVPL